MNLGQHCYAPTLHRSTIIRFSLSAGLAICALSYVVTPSVAAPVAARASAIAHLTRSAQTATTLNYIVTDLGPIPAAFPGFVSVTGVDDSDNVVATLCCNAAPAPANTSAALFTGGIVWPLGKLGGFTASGVNAVNASGYAVGQATRLGTASSAPWQTRAVAFNHGSVIDLGVAPGATDSVAAGVNRLGDAVGTSTSNASAPIVTVFRHGKAIALGAGSGSGINARGIIIGTSLASQATFYSLNGTIVSLGTLGGTNASSVGTAINEAGEAVGYAQFDIPEFPNHVQHAFAYYANAMHDLGLPTGVNPLLTLSNAAAINDRGEIVGFYAGSMGGPPYGFLYTGGKMLDLTSLVAPSSGWVIETGAAINNCGDIAGTGVRNGQMRAVLLRRNFGNLAPGRANRHC